MPDEDGNLDEIVLGYDTLEEYVQGTMYFGATLGRFANRIGGASFSLGGERFEVAANEGKNQLHGGVAGFDKKVWTPLAPSKKSNGIALAYSSPDGEEGYPGNLNVVVSFSLSDDDELNIEYHAETDRDTVINLSNHTYFNLSGGKLDVLGHAVRIDADAFTVTNGESIPTGEIRSVSGTPMDFRTANYIGSAIGSDYEQVKKSDGFDSNFVLNGTGYRNVGAVMHFATGRAVEVWTDQPGMQLYTGNFIADGTKGRDGVTYGKYSGVCFETQNFPDAVNKENFPSAILRRGETFNTKTTYKFVARSYRTVFGT
jgi:aldose 1-epimerase